MFKPSEVVRFLGALVVGVLLLGLVVLRVTSCSPLRSAQAPPGVETAHTTAPLHEPTPLAPPDQSRADCRAAAWAAAAEVNAGSLHSLAWAPFRRPETGWEIYVPLIAHEIGTSCPPGSEGFAAALAAWGKANGQATDGVMTEPLFAVLRNQVQDRRAFLRLTSTGACPDGANDVVQTRYDEGYGGKPILVNPGVLAAYRRMVAAARGAVPEVAQDPGLLTIFSGYRSPVADAQRCAQEGNCDRVVRANCSAHRTGLALDLTLGHAPGYPVDSSADPNRLYMTRTAAYRWLVANAPRFGFQNYPFEPWHWEWTGAAP